VIALLKGSLAGIILAFVLAEIVGRLGSTGGMLRVFEFHLHGIALYWSWPMFVAATGLSTAIFAMLE
jgi:hypothetical protein